MNKDKLWTLLCVVFGLAIIAVAGWGLMRPSTAKAAESHAEKEPTVIVQEKVVEKNVEVEKVITGEIIEERLEEMGVLITQSYNFTEVINCSESQKLFLWIDAEAGFVASYDGVITAGIDFGQVKVTKDEEKKTIEITVPKASIQQVDVDPESFVLYSETSTWGKHLSVEDFNQSLVALEMKAKMRAIDKGLLTEADKNAELLIRNFVSGLTDTTEYKVSIVSQ